VEFEEWFNERGATDNFKNLIVNTFTGDKISLENYYENTNNTLKKIFKTIELIQR
jgi:uncharacterized iron-regulated protein